ncbi:uncharacterized protein [Pyxicephalus adspersus]|uniref:uncharacterized protein n=1 Tax=Pyxicephalus adspersus TaxID=30357 RepID=UPI003B5AC5BA
MVKRKLETQFYLFTDNGVIIFQRNSYDPIYTMRYPLGSFYSNDYYTPPMIAVFWADADFSRMGELYYQTYDFQASPNQFSDFKTKLETEIKSYFTLPTSNFKALWAIKITWERVLPYPAYFFSSTETSTYQAVLVTDGIYSFCLMRFEDGGMKWNYYSIPPYYLPKMGYFSGEPSYSSFDSKFPAYNDPQTDNTASIHKRYTPDQYKGQFTNKIGYWAYRLEYNTAFTVNYKQKCLSWYYNEMNPNENPFWMYYSRPCPCSYRQAIFDSSYRRASDLQNYGIPQKYTDSYSQYYTFQTAFSTWFGGGTRCYYNIWQSLSYGEKERYLPTPWDYENSWLRWTNPYYYYNSYYSYYWSQVQTIRSQYQANEVDPYNNCCIYSGSSYLCSLYRTRRPYDFCSGYIPPSLGWLFGDPHISTLDGVQYTFNGLGEFTLVNVRDENNTLMFTLQGRTGRAGNGTQATNFIGLAAKIQNQTTVEWLLQDTNITIVRINGTTFTLPDNSTHLDKITLEKTEKQEIMASFDGGISITVSAKVGALSFTTMLDVTYKNKTEGLLGVFNDDKSDDLMAANGTKLEFNGVKLPNESLIFEIGLTWKTTPFSSIFMYNETEGESWYTYNNNSFVPLFYDELLLTSDPDFIKKANDTCKGNDECIFDILSTKNIEVGQATLGSVVEAKEQSSSMNNFPPNVTGPTTLHTKLSEPLTVIYTATDENNDVVVFSLQTDSSDINITADGTLVWLPTSSSPVNVSVIANDSKVATQVVLTLVLCKCTNKGSCLYNSPLGLGNKTTNFMVAGCSCSAAWTGMYCEQDFNACEVNNCFDNNTCKDHKAPEEGYDCGPCPFGLTGNGVTCTDINECYLNTSNCQQICNNYVGGYTCSCNEGYTVDALNSSLCEDINECAMNITMCPNQSQCINTNGSYECACLKGFYGANCDDIDECRNSTACPADSTCHNTFGSFYCGCNAGFSGENCTDIDECSLDIDECQTHSSICGKNALCNNTIGSYDCSCNDGFAFVNGTCEDINECASRQYCTGAGRRCENTEGSYKCLCQDGYKEVNNSCIDIDECLSHDLNCSEHAICSNVAGSYLCECKANYTGNGVNCTALLHLTTSVPETNTTFVTSGVNVTDLGTSTNRTTATTAAPTANSSTTTTRTFTTTSTQTTSSTTTTTVHTTSGVAAAAVDLFPYGSKANDTTYLQRSTDFTSPLFQPLMGFPFGNQLRNLIYYTDNGHIIFPLSRNDIFSYTNPPVNGFGTDCTLASIAVFWNDADFSKNVGTTYYNEYQSRNNSIVPKVEDLIKNYTKTSYTAQWTLKITWENAPAYPATENDVKTSTYQAVLTTDGFSSYVLMLYKDGGMKWDLTKRYPKPLMGYCSGNMDGFFSSKFIESNSELQGLKLLNSTLLDNSRMKCLNWYNAQPSPSSWNSALLSCPCLYSQGISDSRYRATKSGGSSMISLLRSTFSNNNNAGVRCMYYRKNQFLEGFQERVWISSSSKSDSELDAYDTCCNQVEDPQFCSMYMQKRPAISCTTYRPLAPGWMFGDPHMTSLDGLSYTFNGLGDFTLVQACADNINFTLQGRTEQTPGAQATNFKAFAVQYSSSNATIKVEWYLESDNSTSTFVNGQIVSFSYSEDMDAKINDSNPAVFLLKNDSITATFEGVLSVSVSQYYGMFSAVSSLPSQFLGKTTGLLGTWNNNQSDDFTRPNGTTIPMNSTEEAIYQYGLLWNATNNTLFTRINTSGRSSFTPMFLSDLITKDSTLYETLQKKCNNKTECIYDAMSTNNTNLGLATMAVYRNLQQIKDTLNAVPPYINGIRTIQTFTKTAITVNFTSNGTGVTFSADPNTNPDIQLLANGSLTWTPKNTEGFVFTLVATESKGFSSTLQPSFVICNCTLKEQCNYNMTRKINSSSLSIAGCVCTNNYTGEFCQNPPNRCMQSCYPSVPCDNANGCGPCPAGFTGDGLHCTDYDECSTKNNSCSEYAYCNNTIGSYNCTCKEGFIGDGRSCCGACDSSFCSNGGTCTKSPPFCTPVCQCPDAYTGDYCTETKDRYQAQLPSNTTKKSVYVTFESTDKFNKEDVYYKIGTVLEKTPLYVMSLFDKTTSVMGNLTNSTNNWSTNFTARFTYKANRTIITFLNEDLLKYFSQKTQRSKRTTQLNITDVQNGDSLSADELAKLMSCEPGYVLDSKTFECVSKCNSYCTENGICKLVEGNATCTCKPFSIYITSGEHCENISMKLNAFFGILFGSLAFLFLLMLGIVLGVYYYCKRKSKNEYDDTDELYQTRFSWKPSFLPAFEKLGEKEIPSLNTDKSPNLITWKPHLEKVDSMSEVKIKRPEFNTNVNNYG